MSLAVLVPGRKPCSASGRCRRRWCLRRHVPPWRRGLSLSAACRVAHPRWGPPAVPACVLTVCLRNGWYYRFVVWSFRRMLCRRRSACVADVLPLPLLLRWILGRRWCSSLADTLLPASLWSMRILCRISSDGYLAVDGLFPSRYFAASVALVWADALPPRSCRYGGYFAAMGFAGLPSGGYFATSVVDGRVVSLGGCFATPG